MKLLLKGIGDHWGTTAQSNFDPKNCSVRISVDIESDENNGSAFYYLQVVTTDYLFSSQKSIWGKSVLVVQLFSWDEIEREIGRLISEISSDTWENSVKILSRYMDWEYEGMKGADGHILIPFGPIMNK